MRTICYNRYNKRTGVKNMIQNFPTTGLINTLPGEDFFLLEGQALERLEEKDRQITTTQTLFLKNLFECKQLLYCSIETKTRYYVFHKSTRTDEPIYRITTINKLDEPQGHESFDTLQECIKGFIRYLNWCQPQWITAEMI